MKTLRSTLTLGLIALLAGGASAPDIIEEGYRIVAKDMRVSSGKFADTHFVFVIEAGRLIPVLADTQIRAYMFAPKVFVAPKKDRKELSRAFVDKIGISRKERDELQKKRDALLAKLPRSEALEGRETVKTDDPVHSIKVRYVVSEVKGKRVVLKKTRTLFGKSGTPITAKEAEEARRSFASLLMVVAGLGVVGLGWVASKRGHAA